MSDPYSWPGLFGLEVITSPWLTRTVEVERTWKERLFSWPWRPLRKTRFVEVASDEVFQYENKVVMHPATFAKLQKELKVEV